MKTNTTISETDILAEVVGADAGDLPPDVARAILKWKFSTRSLRRMSQLAEKNQQGVITAQERESLERYLRIGGLINLVQAKAHLSLKQAAQARK